jgi:hypothetical protein
VPRHVVIRQRVYSTPLRRRLLNLLTALSLLLFAISAWLWVRGHRVEEEVEWRRSDHARRTKTLYEARNARGRVVLLRYRNTIHEQSVYDFFERRGPYRGWHLFARPPSPGVDVGGGDALRRWEALGFGYLTWTIAPPDYSNRTDAVTLPHWFLCLVATPAPFAWAMKAAVRVRAWPRERRRRRGLCPACGYDLRATPGRCPECGAASGGAPGAVLGERGAA